jgi:hypothetical protein
MWKITFGLAAAFLLWKYWSQTPFAGMVSTGWGGNLTGNLPSVMNPRVIVGNLSNGGYIYGPPAPSQMTPSTNGGSGGGF